ncbi:MAG: FAD-binding oxidoreductase [Burkholderiales bacterium]
MNSPPTLARALADIVGAEHALTDPAACDLASSDLFVWPARQRAELVVRPGNLRELSAVMKHLHETGMPAVPRGAGMSYTGGVVPSTPAAVLDLTRLATIAVHAEDLYAVVGAGCTWEALAVALKPHGLRAVQPNPISGTVSTVGGAAAQNIPGGMQGIVGLTVVLADGTVARTGSGAIQSTARGQRNAGPDLTGLFLGDCGAFGIKAEIVLRLAPDYPVAFASFAYDDADAMLADMAQLLREGLVTRVFSLDQAKTQSATHVSVAEAAGIVGAVVRSAGSVTQAVRDVAQLASSKRAVGAAAWSLHCVVEAPTQALADAQLALARKICVRGAKEIDNVLPKTLRAKPYSIRGFVGPAGERWIPIHGIVPLSRARACMAALQSHLALHEPVLSALGITHSWMISSAGAYITIEPMLYWPDVLDPIHLQHLSARNRVRFGSFAPNPAARERVRALRMEICELMDRHDAIHAQIGRYYPYADRMDTGSRELLQRIKHALDPNGTMNPGALLPYSRKTP